MEYIQLALEHKPLNLGQGFPDFACPDYITSALADIAKSDNALLQQYTRGFVRFFFNFILKKCKRLIFIYFLIQGHPRLINIISKLYSKLVGFEINPQTEVLVTSGAYEALYAAILGHVDDCDEVIIIEPFFDCYEPMVRSAGGIPKFIPLRPVSTKPLTGENML